MRWYLVGAALLGILGVLAGCSGGNMFAEREPWRHDAEVQCIESGMVREGPGAVRIKAVRGPGVCGADYPFRVSSLGGSSPLGFADDPRPPGTIPGRSQSPPRSLPRWPIRPGDAAVTVQELPPARSPAPGSPSAPDEPVSLVAPRAADRATTSPAYDLRRQLGERTSARDGSLASPREDYSPVPYERRPLVDTHNGSARGQLAPGALPREPVRAVPAVTGTSRASIGPVTVSPNATLACPMVSALDQWISASVQPAAMRWFGVPVAEITQISAYSCRGMNGNPRARISEHAFGNALDISGFTLADGRKITVRGGWSGLPEEQGFLRDIQGAACDHFTTVLAPGSNVYHYDHFHVDLMRRSGRACNPRPLSGEEVAARASARHAGRRMEPAATGSIARPQRTASKRLRLDSDDDVPYLSALPLAEPGNDGED